MVQYTEEENKFFQFVQEVKLEEEKVIQAAHTRHLRLQEHLAQERTIEQARRKEDFAKAKVEYTRAWSNLDGTIRAIKSQKYREIDELVREDMATKNSLEQSWKKTVKQYQSICNHLFYNFNEPKERRRVQCCVHCDYNPHRN